MPVGIANGRQRVRQPDSTSRKGYGFVKKIDSHSVGGASRGTHLSLQRGGKFRACGVVLHRGWVGLRVSQHLAAGINDGGALVGFACRLFRNFWQGFAGRGRNSRGKQEGLLAQRAFYFAAQHSFPGSLDQHIHRKRARRNQYQGGGEQLKKNAAFHSFGTSKRYPAPRTVFRERGSSGFASIFSR